MIWAIPSAAASSPRGSMIVTARKRSARGKARRRVPACSAQWRIKVKLPGIMAWPPRPKYSSPMRLVMARQSRPQARAEIGASTLKGRPTDIGTSSRATLWGRRSSASSTKCGEIIRRSERAGSGSDVAKALKFFGCLAMDSHFVLPSDRDQGGTTSANKKYREEK